MRDRASVLLAGALAGAVASCDFPISTDKYEVVPASPEDARVGRIVRAFSGGDTACETRLLESCRQRFEACAGVEGCADFAVCVREIAAPDAFARCSSREAPRFETVEHFTAMRECWATAFNECGVGTDFGCVGNYTAPTPQRSPLVVTQKFDYAFLGTPIDGARVRFCAHDFGCELLAEATTDEAGRYQATVPIALEPPGLEGFRGVRRIEGAQVYPHLLARNVPMWTDHDERTSLMSVDSAVVIAGVLADMHEVTVEELGAILLVQAFDCQSGPAGNLVFEVPTDPDALIVYASNTFEPDATSTIPGVGSASITTRLVDQKHRFTARRETTGEVVATGEVHVAAEGGLILSLQPEPVE